MRTSRVITIFISSLLLISLLMAAGCGGKATPIDPMAVTKSLIGKVWVCENMYERDVQNDSRLTLQFMEDGTVHGTGGCNNFSGKYEMAAESFKIGPLLSTKKACSPATDEQEYSYLSFLQIADRIEVDGDELLLFSRQAGEPMRFYEEGSGSLW